MLRRAAPVIGIAAVAIVGGGPVAISHVPPGTYYVRVRAVGSASVGPPTADAIVIVR